MMLPPKGESPFGGITMFVEENSCNFIKQVV